MRYYGTRDRDNYYSLNKAALLGLAPCGGLFMPEVIPQVDMAIVEAKAKESFASMAHYLTATLFGEDIEDSKIRQMVFDAFNFDVPLHSFGDNIHTLELFHGPTLAFKDFGARFMGQMIAHLRGKKQMTILTATSGDTGSAVAGGFYGIDGVKVVVLYPKGRVSDFQERQMTTLGGNINAIRVDGAFDDCQNMVKSIFSNHQFCSDNGITSANSISILRWIPQSFYYFYGYCKWKEATSRSNPTVVVPSGNYGNITAGMLAKKMGLPINGFVAATNNNRSVPEYLKSGIYNPKPTIQTISNAMDVGNPSNFERMIDLYNNDFEAIKADLSSFSYDDNQTIEAIQYLHKKYSYVSDPHSAVGYMAYRDSGADGFYLSTAHASKFDDVLHNLAKINENLLPESMGYLFDKEKVFIDMSVDNGALKAYLEHL